MERREFPKYEGNWVRIKDYDPINLSDLSDTELAGLWQHFHYEKVQVDHNCATLQREYQMRQQPACEVIPIREGISDVRL